MRLLTFLLLFVFIPLLLMAQDSTLIVSPPVDISQDGWNKVLQLSNGNTILFHFELRKHTIVKVFDKAGKELASRKVEFHSADVTMLDEAYFDGLYEINGEAVLFLTQDIDNVTTLLRCRFNAESGNLIAEDKVIKSASYHKMTTAYVLKKPGSEIYNVLTYSLFPTDTAANLKLISFNNKHEIIKEIPYLLSKKGYDNINFISADIEPSGDILVSFAMNKIIQYPNLNERTLTLLYMSAGGEKFTVSSMVLPTALEIVDADFTINPFANNVNLFISKRWLKAERNGLEENLYNVISQSMYIYPKDFSGVKESSFLHQKANEALKKINNNSVFTGTKIAQSTNDRGITTVVFESKGLPKHVYDKWKSASPWYCGNICITQFDDAGHETWATIIPKSNYFVQMETYPRVFRKTCREELFQTLCFNDKKCYYILYNDNESNYDKSLVDSLIDVFDYSTANTVYYHLGKKNVITKKHFFNISEQDVYSSIYPSSAHYNEESKILAVMCRRTKGKLSTLHIAWRKMED